MRSALLAAALGLTLASVPVLATYWRDVRPSAPPSTASTARPEVPPNALRTTRQEAIAVLRGKVTEREPLLFPAAIPEDWTVDLLIDSHGAAPDELSLWFSDPQRAKIVQLSVRGSNVLIPTEYTVTTGGPTFFRTDPKVYYLVADGRDPRSDRRLVWHEPEAPPPDRGLGGTGYSLTTSGLTEDEFWRIANSLERIAP